MDIRQELYNGLKEIRDEVGGEVKINYIDSTSGSVKAILYNRDVVLNNTVIESRLIVNILKKDLLDKGLAITGIKGIVWNRVEYVPIQRPISNWQEVIVLECKILGV